MHRLNNQQKIYETMQKTQILLRCYLSCVMNIKQKEILWNFLCQSNRYMQQFRSAVSATGEYLDEITVWNTMRLYSKGYAYRYFSSTAIEVVVSSLLSNADNRITMLSAGIKPGSRSYFATQRYLDVIAQTQYFMQAP